MVSPGTRQSRSFSAAYRAAHEDPVIERPGPALAFAAARDAVIRGDRLDMRRLAAEVGVGRATLYRWTGDREQLLTEVYWSISKDTLDLVDTQTAHLSGSDRIELHLRTMLGYIVNFPPIRSLFADDAALAFRVLAGPDGAVHAGGVDYVRRLLVREFDAGHLQQKADPNVIAEAVHMLIEGFVYKNFMVGVDPDVDAAVEAALLLVR